MEGHEHVAGSHPVVPPLPTVAASVWPLAAMPESRPVPASSAQSIEFPGTAASLKGSDFEETYLALAFPFHLAQAGPVQLMFNTNVPCRVWVEDGFLLEREGGVMAPSFHRVPAGQSAVVDLPGGAHILTAVLKRPDSGQTAQWVVGAGDPVTKQWIATAFHGGVEPSHNANSTVPGSSQ